MFAMAKKNQLDYAWLLMGKHVSSIKSISCSVYQLNTYRFDPSQLRTPTPGKLVRYLVTDNSHIDAGTAYAEIEVGWSISSMW